MLPSVIQNRAQQKESYSSSDEDTTKNTPISPPTAASAQLIPDCKPKNFSKISSHRGLAAEAQILELLNLPTNTSPIPGASSVPDAFLPHINAILEVKSKGLIKLNTRQLQTFIQYTRQKNQSFILICGYDNVIMGEKPDHMHIHRSHLCDVKHNETLLLETEAKDLFDLAYLLGLPVTQEDILCKMQPCIKLTEEPLLNIAAQVHPESPIPIPNIPKTYPHAKTKTSYLAAKKSYKPSQDFLLQNKVTHPNQELLFWIKNQLEIYDDISCFEDILYSISNSLEKPLIPQGKLEKIILCLNKILNMLREERKNLEEEKNIIKQNISKLNKKDKKSKTLKEQSIEVKNSISLKTELIRKIEEQISDVQIYQKSDIIESRQEFDITESKQEQHPHLSSITEALHQEEDTNFPIQEDIINHILWLLQNKKIRIKFSPDNLYQQTKIICFLLQEMQLTNTDTITKNLALIQNKLNDSYEKSLILKQNSEEILDDFECVSILCFLSKAFNLNSKRSIQKFIDQCKNSSAKIIEILIQTQAEKEFLSNTLDNLSITFIFIFVANILDSLQLSTSLLIIVLQDTAIISLCRFIFEAFYKTLFSKENEKSLVNPGVIIPQDSWKKKFITLAITALNFHILFGTGYALFSKFIFNSNILDRPECCFISVTLLQYLLKYQKTKNIQPEAVNVRLKDKEFLSLLDKVKYKNDDEIKKYLESSDESKNFYYSILQSMASVFKKYTFPLHMSELILPSCLENNIVFIEALETTTHTLFTERFFTYPSLGYNRSGSTLRQRRKNKK